MNNNIKPKPKSSFIENGKTYLLIDDKYEIELNSKIKELNDYMSTNIGKGKTDEEKDDLYKNAQSLWVECASIFKDMIYNFNLNRPQYELLTDIILNKTIYDVNNILVYNKLNDFLKNMHSIAKYKNDEEIITYPINRTEISCIYHLFSKYTIKGINNSTYRFGEITQRICDINLLINYYDEYTNITKLSDDIMNWVTSFEDGVTYDKFDGKNQI
jgi:hypothetical protein